MERLATWLLARVSGQAACVVAACGIGLCRAILGWNLGVARSFAATTVGGLCVGVGETVGFVLALALAHRRESLVGRRGLSTLACSLVIAGAALVMASGTDPDGAATAARASGLAVVATGFSLLYILWLECASTFDSRRMLVTLTCGYLVNLGLWFVLDSVPQVLGAVLCGLMAFASALLVHVAYRVDADRARAGGVPCGRARFGHVFDASFVSWRLALWVAVFAWAYGMGDSITRLGYATLFSKLGMALPHVLVLACLLFMSRKFDMRVFHRMTLVLMLLGLMGAFFSERAAESQLLMSAANESCALFSLAMACFVAHRTSSSAAGYAAVIMLVQTLLVRCGVLCGDWVGQAQAAYVVALMCVMVCGVVLLREGELEGQLHLEDAIASNESGRVELADGHGLSQRERDVFLLLCRGASYDEIASELFIAPSTVRAHASRIYEKFGVHTREELDAVLAREAHAGLLV